MASTFTHCQDCGRKVSSARAVREGRGSGCSAKARKAARELAETMKPESLDKARELIADGGITRIRPTVFLAVSSDGSRVHRTAPQGCTCRAGLRGINCYHRDAVRILLAA